MVNDEAEQRIDTENAPQEFQCPIRPTQINIETFQNTSQAGKRANPQAS
jgi:hypothetical protein